MQNESYFVGTLLVSTPKQSLEKSKDVLTSQQDFDFAQSNTTRYSNTNKILKKLLIFIISFITIFIYQGQTWAMVSKTDNVSDIITIEKNNLLKSNNDTSTKLSNECNDVKANSIFVAWIASIFVPGLGQIALGEVFKGILIWLSLFILVGLVIASGGSSLVSLVVLIIYILNIIDAFFTAFNKEQEYCSNKQTFERIENKTLTFNNKLGLLEDINLNKYSIYIIRFSF